MQNLMLHPVDESEESVEREPSLGVLPDFFHRPSSVNFAGRKNVDVESESDILPIKIPTANTYTFSSLNMSPDSPDSVGSEFLDQWVKSGGFGSPKMKSKFPRFGSHQSSHYNRNRKTSLSSIPSQTLESVDSRPSFVLPPGMDHPRDAVKRLTIISDVGM